MKLPVSKVRTEPLEKFFELIRACYQFDARKILELNLRLNVIKEWKARPL